LKVLIPRPGSWFAEVNSRGPVLSGPYHDSGEPWQSINFSTADLTTFSQGNKIAGENSVFHQKVGGNIYVVPQLSKQAENGVDHYGRDLYIVNGYRRSGSYKMYKPLTTAVTLAITGQDSGFHDSGRLYDAVHSARVDTYQVQECQVHTFKNNAWKDQWQCSVDAIKISRIDADSYYYTSQRFRWELVKGVPSESVGRALARRYANEKHIVTAAPTRWKQKYFLDDVGFSMSSVKSWINSLVDPYLFQNLPSLNYTSWGDLVHEATGNLDANSANMIAFFRDLKDIKTLIPKLKELGKISTHASNYLAVEYGVLPTISDLKAIWDSFSPKKFYDRSGYRRVSAYEIVVDSSTLLSQPVQVTHTRRVHVAVNDRDTGLDALSEKLRSMGTFPSLTNLWDLVPYSFVLDWFIDVGSVLERIDTHHRLINLDIPYVIKSDKIEVILNSIDPNLGAGLDLVVSRYSRDVTTDVPQPRIFGEISKLPTAQDHWVEGSALIIQRTKK